MSSILLLNSCTVTAKTIANENIQKKAKLSQKIGFYLTFNYFFRSQTGAQTFLPVIKNIIYYSQTLLKQGYY